MPPLAGPQQTVHNCIGMRGASSREGARRGEGQAGKRDGGGDEEGRAFHLAAGFVPSKPPVKDVRAVSLKAPRCSVKVQQKLDHQEINLLFNLE